MKAALAAVLLVILSTAAQARSSPYPPVTPFEGDRYSARQAQMGADVARAVQHQRKAKRHRRHYRKPAPGYVSRERAPVVRQIASIEGMTLGTSRVIGGRPAGCPHRFCGCGASLHLFGRIIPALNLAANWLRFPRAAPAPKMAAARPGHVFVLEQHIRGSVWLVFDANSGGHRTRIHPRSIAGYRIVNPHGRA